jgi:hypothetical protein
MGDLHGIKETKEAVLGAVALANACVAIAADKKLGLDDLSHLMMALPKVIAGLDGIDKLPAEVMDLSSAEGAELVAAVASELALGDEKSKDVVLASLEVLLGIRKIVVTLTKKDSASTDSTKS